MSDEKEKLKVEFLKETEEMKEELKLAFKIIIIGNPSVGKSSLIKRAIKNEFIENYSTTIGFEFLTMYIKVNDLKFKLHIWDTCGQEIYRSIIKAFYKNSVIAIIVYSVEDKKSFEDINFWNNEIKKQSESDHPIFLIGNKSDSEERIISKEEAENYAICQNFNFFMETSAKTGENIKEIFEEIAIYLYNEYKDISISKDDSSFGRMNDSIKLPNSKNIEKKKGCC